MAKQIPLVDYLVLGDEPHLVAHECTACGARFFDRRNACASCFGTEFRDGRRRDRRARCARSRSSRSRRPGIPVPFVAGVVDCDGTSVRANLVNVEPDPEHVTLGMKVRLTTYSDRRPTTRAPRPIGFGFEPAQPRRGAERMA